MEVKLGFQKKCPFPLNRGVPLIEVVFQRGGSTVLQSNRQNHEHLKYFRNVYFEKMKDGKF